MRGSLVPVRARQRAWERAVFWERGVAQQKERHHCQGENMRYVDRAVSTPRMRDTYLQLLTLSKESVGPNACKYWVPLAARDPDCRMPSVHPFVRGFFAIRALFVRHSFVFRTRLG